MYKLLMMWVKAVFVSAVKKLWEILLSTTSVYNGSTAAKFLIYSEGNVHFINRAVLPLFFIA